MADATWVECPRCGSVISDRAAHRNWHKGINEVITMPPVSTDPTPAATADPTK